MLAELEPVFGDGAAEATRRFQQTSGMVMAKGVEDRAFYRWARLTSLNEVGGDPSVFAVTTADFHAAMNERQAAWPHAMTAASTHDTKRSEDVRARIAVLAEAPDLWDDALHRLLDVAFLPDRGFGNLLWQAVVGVWSDDPALRDRLHTYAEKAMREAGDRTTWTDPDEAYETAVHAAVDAAFDDQRISAVLDEVLAHITDAGWSNALAAKLIGLTVPGVPDVYQGSELWEQSLVDPDNRRPVDFAAPRRPARRRGASQADGSCERRCDCVATGPSCSRRTPRSSRAARRPTTSWPSTGVARSRSPPGSRSACGPGRLGRHDRGAPRRPLARPADRRRRDQRRLGRRGRPVDRAAGGAPGHRARAAASPRPLRRLGTAARAGPAQRRRRQRAARRRDDPWRR